MIKEFQISDILNAVNSISKINKKKNKTIETEKEKNSTNKDEFLAHNNQVKSNKSEILVLY